MADLPAGTMAGEPTSQRFATPRAAKSLMRHTDLRLTMNGYTDPCVFDMAGTVETLPAMVATGR